MLNGLTSHASPSSPRSLSVPLKLTNVFLLGKEFVTLKKRKQHAFMHRNIIYAVIVPVSWLHSILNWWGCAAQCIVTPSALLNAVDM